MRRAWRYFSIVAAFTLAAAGIAAAASSSFSDLPNDHPQRSDIEYAVEQGWFQGYGDGTFKPDRAITQAQIATVISRAFPEGSTRADLATFLRGGADRLAATPDPAGDCTTATQLFPTEPQCIAAVGDWRVTAGPVARVGWEQFALPKTDHSPITVLAYVEYAGKQVGSPFSDMDHTLFVKSSSYEESQDCADNTNIESVELLPGASATYGVCFVVDNRDLGLPALLRTTSGLLSKHEVWHKVSLPPLWRPLSR